MLIDSHCHLDAAEFEPDRATVVERARAAGVARIIVPAVCAAAFDAAERAAQQFGECRVAYGSHPLYADRVDPEAELAALAVRLEAGGAVAVGEIGLDLFDGHPDLARQQHLFAEQLRLADRHDLPVVLHLRRAVDPVLKQLRRFSHCGGIAHAFNGSPQQAAQLIGLGFKLGFGGAMTFSGSRRIRALAAQLPLESLVLETDAPDMAPAWQQGQRNEPANLSRYARTLAELRGISAQEVIEATGRNVLEVLPRAA